MRIINAYAIPGIPNQKKVESFVEKIAPACIEFYAKKKKINNSNLKTEGLHLSIYLTKQKHPSMTLKQLGSIFSAYRVKRSSKWLQTPFDHTSIITAIKNTSYRIENKDTYVIECINNLTKKNLI